MRADLPAKRDFVVRPDFDANELIDSGQCFVVCLFGDFDAICDCVCQGRWHGEGRWHYDAMKERLGVEPDVEADGTCTPASPADGRAD